MFIAIEGPDGAGKSTAIKNFCNYLTTKNIDFLTSRHPGTTQIGNQIREIALFDKSLSQLSRQLLMIVDWHEFCRQELIPALNNNKWVISDRCNLISSIMYGLAGGLKYSVFSRLLAIVESHDFVKLDHLFVLLVPFDIATQRLSGDNIDVFEEKVNFRKKVITNYYKLKNDDSPKVFKNIKSNYLNKIAKSIHFINATLSEEDIVARMVKIIGQ